MYNGRYYPAPQLTEGAPAFTRSELKHAVVVAEHSGRTPERDAALILCSATTGLRVSEIAQLEIHHIMGKDGSYLLEGWIPGEYTKSGNPGPVLVQNISFQLALDKYLAVRLRKKQQTSGSDAYRGLNPRSKVFLTETGSKFAMSIKRRKTFDEAGKEKIIEYKACDVLERAFKRFYIRAFGKSTSFSSHSGRKYFAVTLAKIVEQKKVDHQGYDDVVTLMRSQNLQAIQPYLMPTKAEIHKAQQKMI